MELLWALSGQMGPGSNLPLEANPFSGVQVAGQSGKAFLFRAEAEGKQPSRHSRKVISWGNKHSDVGQETLPFRSAFISDSKVTQRPGVSGREGTLGFSALV